MMVPKQNSQALIEFKKSLGDTANKQNFKFRWQGHIWNLLQLFFESSWKWEKKGWNGIFMIAIIVFSLVHGFTPAANGI